MAGADMSKNLGGMLSGAAWGVRHHGEFLLGLPRA
jgi:hypothetical protein